MEDVGLANTGMERYDRLPDSHSQKAPRKGQTIDHILATRRAAGNIDRYGMMPQEEDMSNHRAQIVKIDITCLRSCPNIHAQVTYIGWSTPACIGYFICFMYWVFGTYVGTHYMPSCIGFNICCIYWVFIFICLIFPHQVYSS